MSAFLTHSWMSADWVFYSKECIKVLHQPSTTDLYTEIWVSLKHQCWNACTYTMSRAATAWKQPLNLLKTWLPHMYTHWKWFVQIEFAQQKPKQQQQQQKQSWYQLVQGQQNWPPICPPTQLITVCLQRTANIHYTTESKDNTSVTLCYVNELINWKRFTKRCSTDLESEEERGL